MSENLKPRISEATTLAKNKDVLTPYECLLDACREARKTKYIFSAKAMYTDPGTVGETIKTIFSNTPNQIIKAAYFDYYSQVVSEQIFLDLNSCIPFVRSRVERLKRQKSEFFEELEHLGVKLVFLNQPSSFLDKLLPIKGRDHIKGIHRDWEVFYFGGLNFDDETADCAEFMVKFTGYVATKIARIYDMLHSERITEDFKVELSHDTSLLFDVGQPSKSLILDNASELIKNATEKVEHTAYLPPDGIIAELFSEATKHGVDVEVLTYIPHFPSPIPFKFDHLHWLVARLNMYALKFKRLKFPISKNPFRVVHAKLLIIDRKWALFGSHNLSDKAVRAGTQEWAILTSDQELVSNLVRKYLDFRIESLPEIQYLI